jgi:uncharacterized secreted repeat protein (TIGR03808 family)
MLAPMTISIDRRHLLAAAAALPALAAPAWAQATLDATDLGIEGDSLQDQTAALQPALVTAAEQGAALALPAGMIFAHALDIPAGTRLFGVPGSTVLSAWGDGPVARIAGRKGVRLIDIGFDAGTGGPTDGEGGLLEITDSEDVVVSGCRFENSRGSGLWVRAGASTIEDCAFSGHAESAIFVLDSLGMTITGNRIRACGNGGIRVWRSAQGVDGSRISGNTISAIRWDDGGNGQNGNGVNVFRAGGVIVSDNHITDCAFSAVRLNATNDCLVRGNVCLDSGECAIFSEFGFSGSIVADNVVDGAVQGISITNFDQGGRLAVVSGNIVRNIVERSLTNPDFTSGTGIHAEADTLVSGNVVEGVPGVGISAGWGPYLRDGVVSDNIVRECRAGIVVSVAPDAGKAVISGNLVTGSGAGIVGMAWDEVRSADLVADAGRYPNVSLNGNVVG